jgi:hypothetical protein
MPYLSKTNAPKLLKIVAQKPHASSEDHEEEQNFQARMAKELTEEDINADPISSSDERPAPSPPKSSKASTSAPKSRPSRDTKATDTGTKRNGRAKRVQAPRSGTYDQGQRIKAGLSGEADKENAISVPSSSTGKEDANESISWGMEHQGPRGTKRKQGNIHAYGGKETGAKKGKALHLAQTIWAFCLTGSIEKSAFHKIWSKREPVQTEEDSDLDEIEMADAQMNTMLGKDTQSKTSQPQKPSAPTEIDKFEAFIANAQPFSSSALTETDADIDTRTNQRPARPNRALRSLRDNLEADVETLPIEDSDTICALCHASVDPDQSSSFYASRPRTVKNQALFCREHKRATAQDDYRALGLPSIDWAALPDEIRSFTPQLTALLLNTTETESPYRKQHAAKLLSGKAAALLSKRKSKKKPSPLEQQEDVFSTIDDLDESTGFYGPRGKRIMMEVIGEVLVDHIGEAQASDPVVGRSGFAAFLQAVLVPELTVMLAMQVLGGVSEGVAKEKIKKSGELGALLHEDVDDEVVAGSGEDEEELSEIEEGALEGLL